MNSQKKDLGQVPIYVFLLLTILRFYLLHGQPMLVGNSPYDDAGFVRTANYLIHGEWLGPYSDMTLIKGAFYPIWIALCHWFHISLHFSQQFLHIVACFTVLVAFRPIMGRGRIALALFTVMLFSPYLYSETRVFREGIYGSLTLLILAISIGTAFRLHASLKSLLPWLLSLGSILGFFWLTREEGVWILPSLAILCFGAIIKSHQEHLLKWLKIAWTLGIPMCVCCFWILLIAAINLKEYGLFETVEFNAPAFLNAYGSLQRLRVAPPRHRVPVTREMMKVAYSVSPAFLELKPLLDGDMGRNAACEQFPDCSDIGGGQFMWTFRLATAETGHYRFGAKAAMAYYQSIADQINSACNTGKIQCLAQTSSMFPTDPWFFWNPILSQIGHGLYVVSHHGPLKLSWTEQSGPDHYVNTLRDVTGSVIVQPGWKDRHEPEPMNAFGQKTGAMILNFINVIYHGVLPYLLFLSFLAVFYLLSQKTTRQVKWTTGLVFVSLWTAIMVRIILLSILDVTAFWGINSVYLSPLFDIVLLSSLFPLALFAQTLVQKRKAKTQ
ncbi:hypothetical protein WDW86_00785 [Bdellovibrionota bacterium FG-2]